MDHWGGFASGWRCYGRPSLETVLSEPFSYLIWARTWRWIVLAGPSRGSGYSTLAISGEATAPCGVAFTFLDFTFLRRLPIPVVSRANRKLRRMDVVQLQ